MDLSKLGGISIIPLAFASIASLSIILERSYFWYATKSGQNVLKRELLGQCFNDKDINYFKTNARQKNHIMTIFFQKVATSSPSNVEQLRESCYVTIEALEGELNRYKNLLGTIVSIAPLIGLLGTVLGLIRSMGGLTLEIISESHTNLMDGISEALMSTAAGLIIAITTLLANNIFKMLRTSEMEILQEAALEIEEKFKSQITSAQCQ